jgi:ATP-binding protein involved in chromosome partitioning
MNTLEVTDVLRQITDPATGADIISAKMVSEISIDGNVISFALHVKDLESRFKGELNLLCNDKLQEAFPGAEVNVHMMNTEAAKSQDSNQDGSFMNFKDLSNSPLPHVKNIIAVASGKGGVGKSTVSVNLALGLKSLGYKVGLLDGDIYGPSIPTMLGLKGRKPAVKKLYGVDKLLPIEAFGIHAMSIGFFIEPEQAVVLRGPKLDGIIRQFVTDVIWPDLDFMVIDLPPGTGDVQLSLVQLLPLTGAIMVVTPQDVAVDDAIKAMNMFSLPSVEVPILGIIENMSWFTPAELPDNKYYLFGQGGGQRLVDLSGSTLLGQVPIVQSIREGGDKGSPAVLDDENASKQYYLEIASNVNRETNIRNEVLDPTKIVERS